MTVNEAFASIRSKEQVKLFKQWYNEVMKSNDALDLAFVCLDKKQLDEADRLAAIIAPMVAAFVAGMRYQSELSKEKRN